MPKVMPKVTMLAIIGFQLLSLGCSRGVERFPPLPSIASDDQEFRERIKAAYYFAADHPDILKHVPCYCGCERHGHTSNVDCFLESRGAILKWNEHGAACTVCVAVALKTKQMTEAGMSLSDVVRHLDDEFMRRYPTRTPTSRFDLNKRGK